MFIRSKVSTIFKFIICIEFSTYDYYTALN